jgi:tRNA(fMet)-specific endonuclease VapC
VTRTLLDTDIFSEVLKGVDQRVAARARAYHAQYGRYTVSAVTVMEVVKGFHRVGSEGRLRQFLVGLQAVDVVAFNAEAAETAGRIYADLERTGQPIGRADPQIAATALRRGLTLVTGNTAHYERIRGLGYALVLDNWRV